MPLGEGGLTSVIKVLDLIHRRFILDSFLLKERRLFIKLGSYTWSWVHRLYNWSGLGQQELTQNRKKRKITCKNINIYHNLYPLHCMLLAEDTSLRNWIHRVKECGLRLSYQPSRYSQMKATSDHSQICKISENWQLKYVLAIILNDLHLQL